MNNDEIFLTEKELERMTGYKYPKLQSKWLHSRSIPYQVSRTGKPIVNRCIFSQPQQMPPATNIVEEPNFGAM